jgi:hypothetical protein
LPVGTEPVKKSLLTPLSKNACETRPPEPTMWWKSPSGSSPAATMRSMGPQWMIVLHPICRSIFAPGSD